MAENGGAIFDRRTMLTMAAAGLTGSLASCAANPHGAGKSAIPTELRRRFVGKVVIITGATSGIGRAAALQFAAEGAKVSFCGRREKLGQEVESLIKARGGEALYVRADVRSESEMTNFADQTVQKFGRLDAAFNNAGITVEKLLHEYSSQEWDDVINTNLRGVFLAIKYEVPYMLANGGGNIVVTSSSNAIATTELRSAYSAAKRGLVGLVQSAAFDYAPHGIRVNGADSGNHRHGARAESRGYGACSGRSVGRGS